MGCRGLYGVCEMVHGEHMGCVRRLRGVIHGVCEGVQGEGILTVAVGLVDGDPVHGLGLGFRV
jgi:hypothetical protein